MWITCLCYACISWLCVANTTECCLVDKLNSTDTHNMVNGCFSCHSKCRYQYISKQLILANISAVLVYHSHSSLKLFIIPHEAYINLTAKTHTLYSTWLYMFPGSVVDWLLGWRHRTTALCLIPCFPLIMSPVVGLSLSRLGTKREHECWVYTLYVQRMSELYWQERKKAHYLVSKHVYHKLVSNLTQRHCLTAHYLKKLIPFTPPSGCSLISKKINEQSCLLHIILMTADDTFQVNAYEQQ